MTFSLLSASLFLYFTSDTNYCGTRSVLSRQCLARRIPNKETLKNEIAAWEKQRNEQFRTIDWQFTTDDARIKLKQLYPSILP